MATWQPEGDQGLWVYQTRMLSRYCWQINGKFRASVRFLQSSNIAISLTTFSLRRNAEHKGSNCDPAQQAVELRIERQVGEGLLEQITLTNYTQLKTSFDLNLRFEADFADPSEVNGKRKQKGELAVMWDTRSPRCIVRFDYKVKHHYRRQGNTGTATLHRGIRLQLKHDQQNPKHRRGIISFRVRLKPRQVWRATLRWVPQLEGVDLPFWGNAGDRKRHSFFGVCYCVQHLSPSGSNARRFANIVTGDEGFRSVAALRS